MARRRALQPRPDRPTLINRPATSAGPLPPRRVRVPAQAGRPVRRGHLRSSCAQGASARRPLWAAAPLLDRARGAPGLGFGAEGLPPPPRILAPHRPLGAPGVSGDGLPPRQSDLVRGGPAAARSIGADLGPGGRRSVHPALLVVGPGIPSCGGEGGRTGRRAGFPLHRGGRAALPSAAQGRPRAQRRAGLARDSRRPPRS